MKKLLFIIVVLLMALPFIMAEGKYEDGVYFAQETGGHSN